MSGSSKKSKVGLDLNTNSISNVDQLSATNISVTNDITTSSSSFIGNVGSNRPYIYSRGLDLSGATVSTSTFTSGFNGSSTGQFILKGATSGTITLTSNSIAGTWTMTLPNSSGSSGQFLITDGSGNLSWSDGSAISGFIKYVRCATIASLPSNTYDNLNGTLTSTTNNSFPSIDGVTLSLNQDILVKNQTSQFQNGIYTLTQLGDGSNPWILTRRNDFNSVINILPNLSVFVSEGSINGDFAFRLNINTYPITLGTTNLSFSTIIANSNLWLIDETNNQLASRTIIAQSDFTYDLGSTSWRWRKFIGYQLDLASPSSNSYISWNGTKYIYPYGSDNLFYGRSSGNTSMSGSNNIGFGYATNSAITSGSDNLSVGTGAGSSIQNGSRNILFGGASGDSINSGSDNISFGYNSLSSITTADNNISIGSGSLQNATDGKNISLGYYSLNSLSTGTQNISIGYRSGYAPNNLIANALTTGNQCIFIGEESGYSSTTQYDNAIAIGYRATVNSSNKFQFGADSMLFSFSNRWDIDSTGHFIPRVSTTYNIGSSSLRVNDYFGTTINLTNTLILGGTATFMAGTSTVAPIQLQSGTVLSSPVNGTVEYDGSRMYLTVSGTRKTIAYTTDAGGITLDSYATLPQTIGDGSTLVEYTGTSGGTFTLPSATNYNIKTLTIKDAGGNAGTNNITIQRSGGATIDGSTSISIYSDYGSVTLYSNGTNWRVI